jgi:DNA polymerase-3 subunit epsilon
MQRTFDDLGTPLCDVTFCIVDLETTGGDCGTDLITEVGAVKVRGGETLGTFQTLVNPGKAIPAMITVLTGITESMVAVAPRIETVLPSFLEFCGDAVLVAHNARFDIRFLNAALTRSDRPRLRNTVVDTLALARRLVRDDVRDCRLDTLARRFGLQHRPTHRALDDALATTDLLHVLLEQAATFGVTGLDDLVALPTIGGHPQVGKLKITNNLPRRPGVYMFHGAGGQVLYVGKATNLRQRVRSYFGSDDRRQIGPMLRQAQRVSCIETPDAFTAAVLELRYIHHHNPRYNRQGTTSAKYCYVRLSTDEVWPRLSIVKDPKAGGVHLGPLPSRTMATLVIEAIWSVAPLRRCTGRIGRSTLSGTPPVPCMAAQLGVAECPCSGNADAGRYAAAVDMVLRGLGGQPDVLLQPLHERMMHLARSQRFEEAAATRDRAQALGGALKRQRLLDQVRAAGEVRLVVDDVTVLLSDGLLIDAHAEGVLPTGLPIGPPLGAAPDQPLPRDAADETLCIARFIDANSHRVRLIDCSGTWIQPITSVVFVRDVERRAG